MCRYGEIQYTAATSILAAILLYLSSKKNKNNATKLNGTLNGSEKITIPSTDLPNTFTTNSIPVLTLTTQKNNSLSNGYCFDCFSNQFTQSLLDQILVLMGTNLEGNYISVYPSPGTYSIDASVQVTINSTLDGNINNPALILNGVSVTLQIIVGGSVVQNIYNSIGSLDQSSLSVSAKNNGNLSINIEYGQVVNILIFVDVTYDNTASINSNTANTNILGTWNVTLKK